MLESRGLAHRLFTPPTVRPAWTAELGGPVEFAPAPSGNGYEVTLRDRQTSTQKPADQSRVHLSLSGEVVPLEVPSERYAARGADGVELSWTTSSRYQHDPFQPSVENKHADLTLSGPGWSRKLEDRSTLDQQSPFDWAPIARNGRTLVQTSDRVIECLDGAGNQVFEHVGTPWSRFGVMPALGPDGRVIVCDQNHGTLTGYRPDGATAWERTTYKTIRCTPLPLEDGSTLVALQSDQNGVTSLQRLDEQGETVQEWLIPGSMVAGLERAQDGTWLVASNDSPRLAGYDDAGQLRWEAPLPGPTLGPPRQLPDGKLMVIGQDGHVTALEVSDPRTAPELPAPGESSGEVREGPDFVHVAGVRLRRR